jgi:hypothetical protein
VPDVCRQRERRGGADVRSDVEENFLHANANTETAKKENHHGRDEKEVADGNPNDGKRNVTGPGESFAHPITDAVAESEKKEECIARGRGIAIAKSEEEKSPFDSDANSFAASKKENVTVAATVRNSIGNAK